MNKEKNEPTLWSVNKMRRTDTLRFMAVGEGNKLSRRIREEKAKLLTQKEDDSLSVAPSARTTR